MSTSIHRSQIESTLRTFDAGYRNFLHETPLMKLPGSALGIDCAEVWLKLEQLQTSGSFKARGMLNRLLSNTIPKSGVIVASGGNAGIATAAAAQLLGVPCEVFVPSISSPAKQARLKALGATLQVTGSAYAEALAACLERQKQTGALLTHAYDQEEAVIGAGTLAAEIGRQSSGTPDSVLVSVGGGGLIAGIATWYANTATRVIALEPELAPTLHAARAAGRPVDVGVSGIAADALGAKQIGRIAWNVTQAHVHQSLLLSDEAIRAAQLWLWQHLQIAAEASAALGLAALQTGVYKPKTDEKVCLVICGANLDLATLKI
ncbi:threonine/serine dehydratase [Variovorax sp. PCZ-1]|uniref:threonine/serine dehydratase n=1 Tax=Variovorax sp. PCZ-1 TaxID=2835533 RepID=UPI001BCD7DDA|nr:threonine/serine dehydratase [Variovorax sp. PCZ-1]MBS7807096.1 threonine/serine dehydratase [Variovorax sp. PCZ-1]